MESYIFITPSSYVEAALLKEYLEVLKTLSGLLGRNVNYVHESSAFAQFAHVVIDSSVTHQFSSQANLNILPNSSILRFVDITFGPFWEPSNLYRIECNSGAEALIADDFCRSEAYLNGPLDIGMSQIGSFN
jgi:hypothetical protein